MNAFARALAEKKAKAANAAHAGRRRHAATERAEGPVEATCVWYRRMGLALVWRQHAPTKYSSQHSTAARRLYFRTGPAGVDFAGLVSVGERWPVPAAFEVKMAGTPSLRLHKEGGQPLLDPHQAEELRARDEAGTIAGILVRTEVKPRGRPKETRWHWLSWRAWSDACRMAAGEDKKILDQEALETFGRPVGPATGPLSPPDAPHWHPVAVAVWRAEMEARRA